MATRKKAAKKPARAKAPARPVKKAPAKKASAKKAPAKKAAARKAPAKKAARKAPGRAPAGTSASQRGTVDAYIAGLGDWRGETVATLRQLIREAVPDVAESIKWGQPVYQSGGPFAHIKAYKSHVNLGFWRGAELVDPKGILKGTGSRMRHVELRSPADIDAATLQSMVRTAAALNHAKGDPTKRR